MSLFKYKLKDNKMSNYTLRVKNASTNNTNFAVFQKLPDTESGKDIFTLAWFSKYAFENTIAEFGWSIDYSAIWSRPGQELKAGVICKTGQTIPVDIDGNNNKLALTYSREHDAFNFEPAEKGTKGSILTNCDSSVPNTSKTPSGAAGIGIGMSGSGVFLASTQPNMKKIWTPKPKYYVVAGSYKQGEILDVQTIYGDAKEIVFNGISTVSVTLNDKNEWEDQIS